MLRKISGIFLIVVSGILSLGGLNTLYKIVTVPIKKTGDAAYDSGQALGGWIFLAILAVIIFFMFRFGLKLLKKKTNIESIEEIGNEN